MSEKSILSTKFLSEEKSKLKTLEIIEEMFDTPILLVREFGTKDLVERIESFQRDLNFKIQGILLNRESKIKFLIHGDAWYNNFLFRYKTRDKKMNH